MFSEKECGLFRREGVRIIGKQKQLRTNHSTDSHLSAMRFKKAFR